MGFMFLAIDSSQSSYSQENSFAKPDLHRFWYPLLLARTLAKRPRWRKYTIFRLLWSESSKHPSSNGAQTLYNNLG